VTPHSERVAPQGQIFLVTPRFVSPEGNQAWAVQHIMRNPLLNFQLASALNISRSRRLFGGAVCLSIAALLSAAAAGQAPLTVTHRQNSRAIPRYEVFEITFHHDGQYASPFFDVGIDVTFTAPSGTGYKVGGFHYGSAAGPRMSLQDTQPDRDTADRGSNSHGIRPTTDSFQSQSSSGLNLRGDISSTKPTHTNNLWKARFAPGELGQWTYAYTFTNLHGAKASGTGVFVCVAGRAPRHGFVRQNPANPFRWVFDDGTPYFPIGIQECIDDHLGVGSVLAALSMEGPFRLDRRNRPPPPPGAIFQPGPAMNPVNGDVYFRNYARAGFNLFRFSQKNCSLALYSDLDHYSVHEGVMVDELLLCARKYRFQIFYGLFGYQPVFNDYSDNAEGMAKLQRFVRYSVNRWGAYVDFWEFLNEQKADARWYEVMTPYLRSLDPYQHPITTSWERPELAGIEINAPHWYSSIKTEFTCDQDTAAHARNWKKFNKPVIVGEQGNTASKEEMQTADIGGAWDIKSSLRMRIRNWTALFNEIAFVFWNTSYAKDGHYMNIWLGPQERQYVHAMQDFAGRLDNDVRPLTLTISDPKAVRGWALASKTRAAVYVHHFADHTNSVTNLSVSLEVPQAARGYWYSPENAAILQRIDAPAGKQTFKVPPFTVDLALLITPDGPPDIDHDGIPNDLDPDDDNDGVPDATDAFPLDPEEWADKDGDLIGDNMDADIAANGIGDDKNKNGIPDYKEMDFDADGVLKASAIPWDAFPNDPKEWRDTDGDGIGDNADTDKDGDGWSDDDERKAGTDPLNPLSFPE